MRYTPDVPLEEYLQRRMERQLAGVAGSMSRRVHSCRADASKASSLRTCPSESPCSRPACWASPVVNGVQPATLQRSDELDT